MSNDKLDPRLISDPILRDFVQASSLFFKRRTPDDRDLIEPSKEVPLARPDRVVHIEADHDSWSRHT